MALKPESEVPIRGFSGMVSNQDPRDLRPGQAKVQVNLTSTKQGELRVRGGLRELTFDTE